MAISIQHPLSKSSLVKTLANCRRNVGTSRHVVLTHKPMGLILIHSQTDVGSVVHSYREKQFPWVVFDYENRPCRQVFAWNNAVKIDQRKPAFHGEPQPPVVRMLPIGTPVAVSEKTIGSKRVVVRSVRRRCNG